MDNSSHPSFKRQIICVLTCVILFFLAGCQRNQNTFQGYIEGYLTFLSVNTDGYLQQLLVVRGTPVILGQNLFALESQPEASQLAQAQEKLRQAQSDLSNLQKGQRYTILQGIQAQIGQATADLELAKKTFGRNQQLVTTNAISKEQFDRATSDFQRANQRFNELMANLSEAKLGARVDVVQAAEAAVAAAVTQVSIAQWYLVKKTGASPATGTVYDTFFRLGEYVPAGRPVLALLIPKDYRVIFYVPEPILSKIALGNNVLIKCDGCGQARPAKISFISSQAEFTPPIIFSKTERRKFVYRVEAQFTDEIAKTFHPGQPVDVSLK